MSEIGDITVDCAGRRLALSVRARPNSGDLIVFTHGFGCAKEVYDGAFTAPGLRDFGLCAFDFPSHGASPQLSPGDSTLENYAAALEGVVRELPHERLFLVCHSMGGAAGLLASRLRLRGAACFINVEGNLVAGDCGIVSRGTAEQEQGEFVEFGYRRLRQSLAATRRPDQLMWARWLGLCEPGSLHALARSLVSWSDGNALSAIFRGLPRRHYVHGSESDLGHLVAALQDVPVHTIADSDHFPMLDNPTQFYSVVGEIVSGAVSSPHRTGVAAARGVQVLPRV
jgi:pimeloyl-ACP methyl ester carboxylesterase